MTNCNRIITVAFCLAICGLPASSSNDDNPFLDIASAFLQNAMQGGEGGSGVSMDALGGVVSYLMQNQQLGDQLAQGAGGGGADLLSGIGSLLANKDMKIDPEMIGSVISMFAGMNQGNSRSKRNTDGDNLDLGNMLGAASEMFQNANGNGQSWLPMIVKTLGTLSQANAEEKAHEHKDHAWFLPPVMEKFHVIWDQLMESEIGRTIWKQSGLEKTMKSFEGPDGKLNLELMLNGLENHSFRRRWIKTATVYLADTVLYFSDPEILQSYVSSAQFIVNSFLKSQGFPKNVMINPANYTDSIIKLADYIVNKYFELKADTGVYVRPAMKYSQEILSMAHSTSRNLLTGPARQALTDKLTDTLNLEVIEPVLRVYRAYRHAKARPHCQEHLMCLVNKHDDKDAIGLPGFKKGLTKLSSLVASAALSYQSGKQIWDLYNAIQSDVDCQKHYPADCSEFHEEELKITTEFFHNEL